MKKITLLLLAFIITLMSCKKARLSDIPPPNNDPNYDAHNNILRVKASSTAQFKITIIEYNNNAVTPYNTQNGEQTTAFDYGFTPIVGHKITVAIQSANGLITSNVMYKGVYLNAVAIKKVGSGSTGDFSYTVSN